MRARALCLATIALCALPALWPQRGYAQDAAAPAGQAIAFDRLKGNCLACHTMRGGDVPSNVGPELSGMKARFPDRNDLIAILNDEQARNPQTVMPPFGRNMILTDHEISLVVDFLYTL